MAVTYITCTEHNRCLISFIVSDKQKDGATTARSSLIIYICVRLVWQPTCLTAKSTTGVFVAGTSGSHLFDEDLALFKLLSPIQQGQIKLSLALHVHGIKTHSMHKECGSPLFTRSTFRLKEGHHLINPAA